MKKLLFSFAILLLITSCKKTPPDNSAGTFLSSRLISAKGYNGSQLISTDTFIYNDKGYLIAQRQEAFNNGVSTDSFSLKFNYQGTSIDPTSYTISDGFGINTFSLTYDTQGRIIKDTLIPDITDNSSTFSYPQNNISYTSFGNGSTDTFYITNGNINKIVQKSMPLDPSLTVITNYTYGNNYLNPFYSTGQSDNVRLLVTKIDGWEFLRNDCISKNAFSSVNENGSITFNVTYTLDSSGRVVTSVVYNNHEEYRYE